VKKFLPISCNFFYYIKKLIQYKLIEVFSIIFYNFFPSFPAILFSSTAAFFVTDDIKITVFKPFKSIRTHSNDYNIFAIRLTNNSVYISSIFFW